MRKSDLFVDGNVYVFSSNKFKRWACNSKVQHKSDWYKKINGQVVEVVPGVNYSAMCKGEIVYRVWCKCIGNNLTE